MNEPDIFDTSTTDDLTDAAIEAALRDVNLPAYCTADVRKRPRDYNNTVLRARVIQRHYPEKMEDPDLVAVWEIVAKHYEARGYDSNARDIRACLWDGQMKMTTALAAYKAGKEEKK